MKKTIIFLIATPFFVFAQQKEDHNVVQGSELLMSRKATKSNTIEGSPYLQKEFLQSQITGYSKKYFLRYNANQDEMEFMQDNEIQYLNKIENLEIHFPTLNKTYVLTNYIDGKGVAVSQYLVRLTDNPMKYNLYKKENIAVISGINGLNSYQKSQNDYYEKQKDTYVIKYQNKTYVVPDNVKKLDGELLILSKDFTKNNKLKLTEPEIIKWLNYLNSKL
ncbi:hypothetical protein [Kaistella montana]|uniref:GLPGLI family protein n=1 Tax=Kaistella montana TaxID=1849733 RepID=A0ABW5KBU9_9FLAO|nr:hypothetical protein [Kaistella montana]MCQ4036035.1 hypothetical protein [Kaistella montana]